MRARISGGSIFLLILKEPMARKKLKMTKKAIAARRRYRAKKSSGAGVRARGRGRGRRRARGRGRGAGFFDDLGSTLMSAGQNLLPMLPMLL